MRSQGAEQMLHGLSAIQQVKCTEYCLIASSSVDLYGPTLPPVRVTPCPFCLLTEFPHPRPHTSWWRGACHSLSNGTSSSTSGEVATSAAQLNGNGNGTPAAAVAHEGPALQPQRFISATKVRSIPGQTQAILLHRRRQHLPPAFLSWPGAERGGAAALLPAVRRDSSALPAAAEPGPPVSTAHRARHASMRSVSVPSAATAVLTVASQGCP